MVVGYSPGATYDIYTRNFARHLGRHLPGNPNVIVPEYDRRRQPAVGQLHLQRRAEGRHHHSAVFARGLAMQPLLDMTGIQYDALKFNWIGSLSSDVSLVLSWHTKPFKTIDDLRTREMVVAGTGSGADSVIFPYILNGVLGTKMKVVTGYPGRRRLPPGGGTPGSRWHRRRVVERPQCCPARVDCEK